MSARRAVIVDRDGTINQHRSDYVRSLAELELLPGVAAALAALSRSGFAVLVATNQACVGKRLVARERLEEIHAAIGAAVRDAGGRIDGWYICDHLERDACACRKPLPGLVRSAQVDWGFDPAATWCVGDSERDVTMAMAAGCRPALVLSGRGARSAARLPEVPAFPDLPAFARMVLMA